MSQVSMARMGPDGTKADDMEEACVAQSVEHVLGKDEVSGSIPLAGSSLSRTHGPKI